MILDEQIRVATFGWLKEQVDIHGDVLPRRLLEQGFEFEGERIPLLSPQGIFKPRRLELPLTFTTVPDSPYEDSFSDDGYLLYKYRGTDPSHRDNIGLRTAGAQGVPLVYFHGLVPGRYVAAWPVYIIQDDPTTLSFKVAVDDGAFVNLPVAQQAAGVGTASQNPHSSEGAGRRAYITVLVRQRLHQRSFREKVLQAYREQCSLCRLRHPELLDAAHIIPDHEPEGHPQVQNGIALCKLHHAAFDANVMGITPDYIIQVRKDILLEQDGPMLRHGLQDLHQSKLVLPRNKKLWPDQQSLDVRYQRFSAAS